MWVPGYCVTLLDTKYLLLLFRYRYRSFAFTPAAKVDAAGINKHAQSFQFFFGRWLQFLSLPCVKRPTGVGNYIIDADTREDSIEFQEARLRIAAHNTYVANHHQLAAASQSIVPAGLLLIARTTRPSHTGYVLDTFGEAALLLYHHDE